MSAELLGMSSLHQSQYGDAPKAPNLDNAASAQRAGARGAQATLISTPCGLGPRGLAYLTTRGSSTLCWLGSESPQMTVSVGRTAASPISEERKYFPLCISRSAE